MTLDRATAVDSSVVVAAFATWHERHEAALEVLAEGARVVSHCLLETYSVLTRMPAPFRVAPGIVVEFLRAWFTAPALSLLAPTILDLLDVFASQGIAGGAVYDGLIGAASMAAGCELATLDERAARTYSLVGCQVRRL